MKKQNTTKKIKGTVFSDQRKLELVMDITRLRRYGANEIAELFGTSRQAINYHMRKREGKNRG